MALKFASDHRERFWGVFFIDTSSAEIAEQKFSKMARMFKVGESMEDFKRHLTNSPEPWLLILDNADDPSLDISRFFPVGTRGTIIVTSRNPDCRSHATVGSRELDRMKSDDAITLLLRSGDLPCEDEELRGFALRIVETLGYLALAVNHAGASIRQRICSLENYLDHYTRHRKKLLSSRPVQAGLDYEYTVYTTWEISVDSIKELAKNKTDSTAANALEFLTFFGSCHFDDITEDMFRSASDNFAATEEHPWWASNLLGIIRDPAWDPLSFNEAIQLLLSYSLIHVSGPNNRISLHPLVHSWIRDSLNQEAHLRWWNITVSTLALAEDYVNYHLQKRLKVHLRHCIDVGKIDDLFQEDVPLDRVEISSRIISIYSYYPFKDALMLSERALKYSRKTLGDECYSTCVVSYQLGYILNRLYEYQKASDLLQDMVDVSTRELGPANTLTLSIMGELILAYRGLRREQEALELAEKRLAICEESFDDRDICYLNALEDVALVYDECGRNEEAVGLFEKLLAMKKEVFNEEDLDVLGTEHNLGFAYSSSGQHQAALEMFQNTLKKQSKVYGEDNIRTLNIMVRVAIEYGYTGQPEKGIPLMDKAIEVGSRIGLENELEDWEEKLKWLQSLQSQSVNASEGEETSSRRWWRLG